MHRKIKIAYCIPSLYYPSGMERVLTLKANYFTEVFKYEIHIILTDGREKKPYYKLHPSIKLHQLDVNYDDLYGLPFYKRFIRYIIKQSLFKKRLDKCLKKIQPDITISLLRRDINFINDLTDGSIKIGEIHFNKANYRVFENKLFPRIIQRIISNCWMALLIQKIKKLDKFIVLTHEDAKEWKSIKSTTVIYNPLPFQPPQKSTLRNKQVIAVGRYMPQKGFDRLISAWKIVSLEYPDWILKIYGDGMKDELQSQIDALKLNDVCFLEKNVPNIMEKYLESSIFTLSSRFEGFGLVIIEAMACGLPIVSFDCPCGPKDIIHNNVNGILVPNGDIKKLAQGILSLIRDEKQRHRMGDEAYISINRFKIENIANQWKILFENLLKQKKNVV